MSNPSSSSSSSSSSDSSLIIASQPSQVPSQAWSVPDTIAMLEVVRKLVSKLPEVSTRAKAIQEDDTKSPAQRVMELSKLEETAEKEEEAKKSERRSRRDRSASRSRHRRHHRRSYSKSRSRSRSSSRSKTSARKSRSRSKSTSRSHSRSRRSRSRSRSRSSTHSSRLCNCRYCRRVPSSKLRQDPCYNCRSAGHNMAECWRLHRELKPQNQDQQQQQGQLRGGPTSFAPFCSLHQSRTHDDAQCYAQRRNRHRQQAQQFIHPYQQYATTQNQQQQFSPSSDPFIQNRANTIWSVTHTNNISHQHTPSDNINHTHTLVSDAHIIINTANHEGEGYTQRGQKTQGTTETQFTTRGEEKSGRDNELKDYILQQNQHATTTKPTPTSIVERNKQIGHIIASTTPLHIIVKDWPSRNEKQTIKCQLEIFNLLLQRKEKIEDDPQTKEINQTSKAITDLIPTKIQNKKRRKEWTCKYCQQKGHFAEFCAKKPNTEFESDHTLTEEEKAFIKALLANNTPTIRQEKSIEEKIQQWAQQGEELNKNNPWLTVPSASHVQRVRSHLGYWKAAGCSKTVLSWLAAGIKTTFENEPPRLAFRPTQSQIENTEFIHSEVMKHIRDGSFKVVSRRFPAVINPVIVDKKKGKLRMCIDTRFPNAYLAAPAFKNETIETVIALIIQKNDYLLSTDISKAYYCVPLHESIQKYFCFEHVGLVICPKVLIFGLNEAPFYFNKIIREMVKFCRNLGIRMTSYFDDQLWATQTKTTAEKLATVIQKIFTNLGLLLNEKAKLTPEQIAEHIGWQINTVSMTLHRCPEKVEEALINIQRIAESKDRTTNLRFLSSVVGQLSAMRLAISAVGCWTVEMYKELTKHTRHKLGRQTNHPVKRSLERNTVLEKQSQFVKQNRFTD